MPKALEIDDSLVDEVVDEILGEIKQVRQPADGSKQSGLESRIVALEKRINRYFKDYQITATEVERHITEKSEDLTSEQERQMLRLQDQIESLRDAMIRLSSEVKKIKESLK